MSSTKKQVIGHLLTLSCGVFSSLAGTLANNTSNYKVTMLSNVMSFTLNISTYMHVDNSKVSLHASENHSTLSQIATQPMCVV